MKLLSTCDTGSKTAEMGRVCVCVCRGELLLAFIHPAHRLEAGAMVSAPRQGAEEDWEQRPPQGR